MFRMYGRIVQILHYQSTSKKLYSRTDGEIEEIETVHYAPTYEEASALGENVTPLPPSDDEWMDGIEVPDVPDTRAAADAIYKMGKEAWEFQKQLETAQRPEKLRADIDYVMLMGGI